MEFIQIGNLYEKKMVESVVKDQNNIFFSRFIW